MKVLYSRVSSIESQKTDRQLVNANEYDYVIEDKISGSTEFATRPGGTEIINLVKKGVLTELAVWEIDRLGRCSRDIVNTIHYFTENRICIYFINQGLRTLNEDGSENPISKLIINIMGVIGEMERHQLKERQYQGIQIAKARGVYKGRNKGTKEDVLTFLSKTKNKKAVELLKKGYKGTEVSKIVGIHLNTVTKIKRLSNTNILKKNYL